MSSVTHCQGVFKLSNLIKTFNDLLINLILLIAFLGPCCKKMDILVLSSIYGLLALQFGRNLMKEEVQCIYITLQSTNPIKKITHHFTINNYRRLFLTGVDLYINITYNNKAQLSIYTFYINYCLNFWVAAL